jgi:hypothetical protein
MARVYRLLPPRKELREVFRYNEKTGKLYWRVSPSRNVQAGTECGCIYSSTGYRILNYNGRKYGAHRIIWMLVTGEDPESLFIDHINRDKTDNRIENLRLSTNAENLCNKPTKGAYLFRNKWRAQIHLKGKTKYLGSYATEAEAVEAYQKAAKELKGDFYFPYA